LIDSDLKGRPQNTVGDAQSAICMVEGRPCKWCYGVWFVSFKKKSYQKYKSHIMLLAAVFMYKQTYLHIP